MADCWECENENTQMCEGCKDGYYGIDGWVQYVKPTHFIPKKPQESEGSGRMKVEDMTEDIYKSGSFSLDFETELSFETDRKIYSRIKEFARTLSDEFGVEVRTHYIPEVLIKYDEFN